MEVLNDPILNRDKEHSLEPILQDTYEDSLSLDHTSDIVSDVQDQIFISHVQDHSLSELKFTTTERGGQCLMEMGFSYTSHQIRGNIVQWQCVQRSVCSARIHTQNQIVIKRIHENTHESNSSIFHCSKVKTVIKRRAFDTQDSTHNIF